MPYRYTGHSGNNTKAKAINQTANWKHTFIAEATKSSDNGMVTSQRSFLSGKSDYKLGIKSYVFGLLEYEDDRFSGFDYQASLIAGYGHKLLTGDSLSWDAEIGAGSKRSELNSGEKNDAGILYAGTELNWKISKSASFNEKLTVEDGDATTTKSVSALKTKINSKLASKITYTLKHVSEVPAGIEKTDRELAITLVYSF